MFTPTTSTAPSTFHLPPPTTAYCRRMDAASKALPGHSRHHVPAKFAVRSLTLPRKPMHIQIPNKTNKTSFTSLLSQQQPPSRPVMSTRQQQVRVLAALNRYTEPVPSCFIDMAIEYYVSGEVQGIQTPDIAAYERQLQRTELLLSGVFRAFGMPSEGVHFISCKWNWRGITSLDSLLDKKRVFGDSVIGIVLNYFEQINTHYIQNPEKKSLAIPLHPELVSNAMQCDLDSSPPPFLSRNTIKNLPAPIQCAESAGNVTQPSSAATTPSPMSPTFSSDAYDASPEIVDTLHVDLSEVRPPRIQARFPRNTHSPYMYSPPSNTPNTPTVTFRPSLLKSHFSRGTISATPTPRSLNCSPTSITTRSFSRSPPRSPEVSATSASNENSPSPPALRSIPSRFRFSDDLPSKDCRIYRKQQSESRSFIGLSHRDRDFQRLNLPRILKKSFSVRELIEHDLLHKFLKDKNGSKYLQEKLKKKRASNKARCEQLVSAMFDYLVYRKEISLLEMAEDVYDNYLVQLLFSCGSSTQHHRLLATFVTKSMLRLSRNKYGCRVVQEILKCIEKRAAIKLVEALQAQCIAESAKLDNDCNESLEECLKCCNGNRVIQAMIELELPYSVTKFIGDELESKLSEYSEDRNACRVVQSFIKTHGAKLNISLLLLDKRHVYLAQKVHGNYVIQCIIKKGEWYSQCAEMVNFRNRLAYDVFNTHSLNYLGVHKQASNVIEACIRVADCHQIDYLITELKKRQSAMLKKLMKHKYGNYVPRTLFDNCSMQQKQRLVEAIHTDITNLYYVNFNQFKHCEELIEKSHRIKEEMDNKLKSSQPADTLSN